MQNPLTVALISLCFILAGTFVGVWLRRRLPAHHLSKESESVVKLGVGLIATLSASASRDRSRPSEPVSGVIFARRGRPPR
jgi:uncharacterized membrane protein YfcA